MRQLTLSILCLLSLSACQNAAPLQPRTAFGAQAALPPDLNPNHPSHPTWPKPCQPRFQSQAFLPPDAIKPNPCPCQKPFGAQAALPPDLKPPTSNPHCK